MSRFIVVAVLYASGCLAHAEDADLRVLEVGRIVSTPATAVEERLAGMIRFTLQFRNEDAELNAPAFESTRPEDEVVVRAAYDDQGRPRNRFAVLVKQSGRSEAALNMVLAAERLRENRIQTISRDISTIQKRMDFRASVKEREQIEFLLESAARIKNRHDELARDAGRHHAAAADFRNYLALVAKASPSEDEARTLQKLGRIYASWSTEDLHAFAAAAERQGAALEARARREFCQSFLQDLLAARRTAALPRLSPRQQEEQRRDQEEVAQLQERLKNKLADRVLVKALLPDDDAVREAYLDDIWALFMGRYSLDYFVGESDDGRARFAAYGTNHIGVENCRLVISGRETLRVSIPEIPRLERRVADLNLTSRSSRDGRNAIVLRATGTQPDLVLAGKAGSFSTYSIAASAGSDIDLRDFESPRSVLRISGGGRFLFSGRLDRTLSRLILRQPDARRGATPAVISLPADIDLKTGYFQLGRNDFTFRLDGMVSTETSPGERINFDVELRRPDGTAAKFPLYRDGECQFATQEAFLAAIEKHREERK